ncbi:retroviral-like aspartic protease family protein [Burkholderia pyrrocinia]|uniref:retroviral-like aspartic protease family protein n=1 Tax=Burkholderia pyrrocinia TaxID=60550 RepID=UPI00157763CE|nr:retroviral-like aspartic protease family protein [Burkholderia pyrrocinia]NTX29878.1 retroviral-like aspartic protease family protein [Burkholderia pyrrocinia]
MNKIKRENKVVKNTRDTRYRGGIQKRNRREAIRRSIKSIALCAALTFLAACDPINISVPGDIKPAVDTYHLSDIAGSDLTKPDIRRALAQLSKEACNRDAMGRMAAQIDELGYRRESANALIQFVDRCGRADGFLSAAANDLMAVSDFKGAVAVADRLLAGNASEPQYYFDRGRAYEGWQHDDAALSDYMQVLALSPNLASVTSNLFIRVADLHAKAGRYCDAVSAIRMWVSADPERADNAQAKRMIAQYASHANCPSAYASGRESFARPSGNTIRVKAKVNGVEGTFIVDTGASYVSLSDAFARRAQVATGQAKRIRLQTANGVRDGLLAQAQAVQVGAATASDVPVSVDAGAKAPYGAGVDGLLGQSFLSRFELSFTLTRWSIGRRS